MASSPTRDTYRHALDLLHTPQVIELLCLLDHGTPAGDILEATPDADATRGALRRLIDTGHVASTGAGQADELDHATLTPHGSELVSALRDYDDYLVRHRSAAADHATSQ